jgi:hypothetical protein
MLRGVGRERIAEPVLQRGDRLLLADSFPSEKRGQAFALFGVAVVAGTNPWLIAIVVALASFMEVLDTTIAL